MIFGLKPQNILSRQETRVSVHDRNAAGDLAAFLTGLLGELNPSSFRPVVLLGIGTDRSTGDSLGPLVGSRVNELAPGLLPVFGTLDDPVHAVNLAEKTEAIQNAFPFPLIIAVDASLGQPQNVGAITIGRGHLKPGTGVHKDLPPVGDIFITGVVNIGGYLEYLVLQNTRLGLVMKMADCIARAVILGCEQVRKKQKQPERLS
ncbi:putative sporulation protein [Thermacetogenium phaeum DSM 12270]|uniref:Putative sporulation protein n=1 Tax=Thermacetogenium phaeum (strain ATCC BAA-254 / DSM 26808 / PB) TaxID=1089553 RepID=K4LE14_THEPS|nr:spore protease YyaC [Thermacetogenium phaeum]AFV10292.1 putative sporulation protein [Thermacetogenium phaeum DSM 12270]